VVIAGDPAACRRVIEGLKCSSLRAPFNYVLHCKAMESEYQALYDLHYWPVRQAKQVTMYSAADDQPFDLSEAGIARAVAHDLCTRLDFPRLIETVYAEGARIFIELGAGGNCAKWVEDSLRGRPCLSISANRKGVDDATAILRVLARLASHQAALDLSPLFTDR
jgi:PfaB family protein